MTSRGVRLAALAFLTAGATGCRVVERVERDDSGFPLPHGALEPPGLALPVATDDGPPRSPSALEPSAPGDPDVRSTE